MSGELHKTDQVGDEIAWWKAIIIDPLEVAERLWKSSRGVVDRPALG